MTEKHACTADLDSNVVLQSRRIDLCLYGASFDLVLHSIEEKLLSQEVEVVLLNALRNVGLEVKQVEIRLIVDHLAVDCWHRRECSCDM